MIISFKAKLAFIAQTKCGSTSIENALRWHANVAYTGDAKVTHMHMFQYRRWILPYLDFIGETGIETTCLFRHPVDWMESWWRYFSQPGVLPEGEDTGGLSFERYVLEWLEGSDRPYHDVGKQSGMLPGLVRKVSVDHLFRYEELDRFVALWEERLGARLALERHNVSPEREGAELSPPVRARLEAALAEEFDIWESQTVGHKPGG